MRIFFYVSYDHLTDSDRAASTLAMVNAMLTSLEKSKNSLCTLAHDSFPTPTNSRPDPPATSPQLKEQIDTTTATVNPKTMKMNLDSTKLQKYQNILSKVDYREAHPQQPPQPLQHSHRSRGDENRNDHEVGNGNREFGDSGDDGDDDQRFDPPKSEFEFTVPSSSNHNRRKWAGESIGVDPDMDEVETNSEMSAIDASDWPPPGGRSKVLPPTRKGFISAEERLKRPPQPITQRSASASRIDARRGHPKNHSQVSSMRSQEEEENSNGHDYLYEESSHSSSRKKSLLSSDRQNAPHYFLKSRHEMSASSSSGQRPSFGVGASSSSQVSKKSIHAVRLAKGMPRVVRLCISHGPMIKVTSFLSPCS
jgi:hypothetical protein